MQLSILIAAYNEDSTLPQLLARLRSVGFPIALEVIVVNDGSSDGTAAVLEAAAAAWPALHVLHHAVNRGKAAAIRTALAAARGEVVVMQDADLELDPNDLPRLLAPILAGEAKVVYGSRFLAQPPRGLTGWANRLLTAATNLLYGTRLTDMETCYKMMRTETLRSLDLQGERFELEPEITAKLARGGCRIAEVPIGYHPRSRRGGKKIGWRDGIAALRVLWKLRHYEPSDPRQAAGGEQGDERQEVVEEASVPVGPKGGDEGGVGSNERDHEPR